MMTVLHINSSARLEGSNTRILSQYLVNSLNQPTISRDLTRQPLPPISAEDLVALNSSNHRKSASYTQQLSLSKQLIKELNSADILVLGVPMYNFGIPAALKQWVDSVCRAGVTFKYTSQGPVGLIGIKQAYIITASGGTQIGSKMDFASPYLEHICRFLGIKEVFHISASGSKGNPAQIIAHGKQQIDSLLSGKK